MNFYKGFSLQQKNMIEDDKKSKHRNNPNRMSDAVIIAILLLFHSGIFATSSIITNEATFQTK